MILIDDGRQNIIVEDIPAETPQNRQERLTIRGFQFHAEFEYTNVDSDEWRNFQSALTQLEAGGRYNFQSIFFPKENTGKSRVEVWTKEKAKKDKVDERTADTRGDITSKL